MMYDVWSCHNCHTLLHSYQLSRLMLTNSKLIPDKVNREHRTKHCTAVSDGPEPAKLQRVSTIYSIYYLSQLGMDVVCLQI